jgi:N-acetylglucosaminyldiphosphoundecaprenol N-acetyl-beta-D-mannosaminyltransferase
MSVSRIRILGVPVDCVDMQQAVAEVDRMIFGNRCELVLAVNPEKVMAAREDPLLLAALEQAGLLIPDGIGVVLAARVLGSPQLTRVPGADLMPALCELASLRGYGAYLLGATPQVNEAAVGAVRNRFPALRISGNAHGMFPEERALDIVNDINGSGADILFVALGSPKQEYWMSRYRDALRVKACQGVGGSFDVLAGVVKRAPAAFRRTNLEWFYRLVSQPRRAARQRVLPHFAYEVVKARISASR